jgi:hypothetical protein
VPAGGGSPAAGEVEGKQEEADAHPWVATARLEETQGGGAMRSSSSPAAVLAAPALRRHWPERARARGGVRRGEAGEAHGCGHGGSR